MNNSLMLKQIRYFSKTSKLLQSMSTIAAKPIETSIRTKLEKNLNPTHLNIINESYMHNVPKEAETHFKVVIVSEKFKDESLLQRHRMVQHLLAEELKSGVHALSIVAKTPDQWKDNSNFNPSPTCMGGFGK